VKPQKRGLAEQPSLFEQMLEKSGIAVPLDAGGKPVEPTPETMRMLLRTHTDVTQIEAETKNHATFRGQFCVVTRQPLLRMGRVFQCIERA